MFGNRVSHAHNVTDRRFNPNLQTRARGDQGRPAAGEGLHPLPALGQGHEARRPARKSAHRRQLDAA